MSWLILSAGCVLAPLAFCIWSAVLIHRAYRIILQARRDR